MIENKNEKQTDQLIEKKTRKTSFIFEMKNPYNYRLSNILLLSSFVIGLLFDIVFIHRGGNSIGIGFFIFEIVFLIMFWEAIYKNIKEDSLLIFSISTILLMSGWFAIFNNSTMSFFYLIIIFLLNTFVILHMAGVSKTIPIYKYLALYLIIIGKIRKGLHLGIQETKGFSKESSSLKTVILSLVVLGLMLLFVVPMLINADAVFAQILNTYIFQYINFDFFNIIGRLVVIFFVGIFIWTGMIIINNLKPIENTKEPIKFDIKNLGSNIVLIGINIVYFLFILVQIKYLFFGNHQMILSLGLNSYAEYVHKGFRELIIIVLFNYFVFRIIQKSLKKENRNLSVKSMLVLLIVFSIIIIGSAFKRIFMYVDAYGLTEQRVFVFYTIFMLFSLMFFCIYKIFKPQINYRNYLIIVFLSSFTLLGYINIDKTIAKYNIEHNIQVKNTYNDSSFDRSFGFRKSVILDGNYIFTLSEDAIDEQLSLASKNGQLLSKYKCRYSDANKPTFLHLNFFKLKVRDLGECEKNLKSNKN